RATTQGEPAAAYYSPYYRRDASREKAPSCARLEGARAMGEEGLEPSHLAVPDPKSGASTSSATRPAAGSKSANQSGGNRTHNLWIKSPLLCQLSYAPQLRAPD